METYGNKGEFIDDHNDLGEGGGVGGITPVYCNKAFNLELPRDWEPLDSS